MNKRLYHCYKLHKDQPYPMSPVNVHLKSHSGHLLCHPSGHWQLLKNVLFFTSSSMTLWCPQVAPITAVLRALCTSPFIADPYNICLSFPTNLSASWSRSALLSVLAPKLHLDTFKVPLSFLLPFFLSLLNSPFSAPFSLFILSLMHT